MYNKAFKQHYHSVKEGAISESLYKHVIPALQYHKNKKVLNILDICFGLGYNILSTIYYIKKNDLDIKVNIYSPEIDTKLLKSISSFEYPAKLKELNYITKQISNKFKYSDKKIEIEIFNGDAREYIKTLTNIDIVYQDPFSSNVNKLLWTKEYFADIYKILSKDGIITTYSVATPIRLSMSENGLYIYEYKPKYTNKITIAQKKKNNIIKDNCKFVDMVLKKQRNLTAISLKDK